MRLRALCAIAIIASVLLPSTVAATPFSAGSLVLSGDVGIFASGGALYVPAQSSAITWEGIAARTHLVREYTNVTAAGPLALGGDAPLQPIVEREEADFGLTRFTSTTSRAHVGLLASGAALELAVRSTGFVDVDSVADPVVAHQAAAAENGGEPPAIGFQEALSGHFVNFSATSATIELRGDFVLALYDVDYTLDSDSGTLAMRTGHYEVDRVGGVTPVARERYEVNFLTLQGAVLRVTVPGASAIFASAPTVTLDGTMHASDVVGLAVIDGIAFAEDASAPEWMGQAVLDLSPDGERLSILDASPTRGPGVLGAVAVGAPTTRVLVAIAAVAALVGLALLAFARFRARSEASLDLALLHMEERRWSDALAQLDALLAHAPTDAALLVDRAHCLEELGRLSEARTGYESALKEAPTNADVHYYYARVLARLHMAPAALAHLEQALHLDRRLAERARDDAGFGPVRDAASFHALVQ